MDFSAEQRQVVEHGAGPLRVAGRAGTGKTTALIARYLELTRSVPPSKILFVCRSREGVAGVRDAVVPALAGGFDSLPIATFAGVAFDVLARGSEMPRRISWAEQRAMVRDLLAAEDPADWPTLGHLLGRPAFVDEVLDGLLRWRMVNVETPFERLDDTWRELVSFANRYGRALHARELVDDVGLMAEATLVAEAVPPPYEHLVVDDFETATPMTAALVDVLAINASSVCAAANPSAAIDSRRGASAQFFEKLAAPLVELTETFRRPSPPVLVRCNHPSVEPEVIAGELLAAREAGAR
ncbi:MAG: ATP-dependent helicase, partial [Acidimicrobiia bacterium]|nr:ATP-dependent helicase [Acidimicrobiia bacterium]